MVEFVRLLCTVEAMLNHLSHCSGLPLVTAHRYCSIHWFFHSDKPSVCGWKAVERFCLIPSFSVSSLPKCKVKRGSLSLIIFSGRPNHR